jgi:hypothetical protein
MCYQESCAVITTKKHWSIRYFFGIGDDTGCRGTVQRAAVYSHKAKETKSEESEEYTRTRDGTFLLSSDETIAVVVCKAALRVL